MVMRFVDSKQVTPLAYRMAQCQHFIILTLFLSIAVTNAARSDPSRLSIDFSSSLIVSPDTTPPSVLKSLDSLLSDMAADGVNNVCNGRSPDHVCSKPASKDISLRFPLLNFHMFHGMNADASDCSLCRTPATENPPCSCSAPGNRTRCTCSGTLTGTQYFDPKWYGLELANVLAIADGEQNSISGGTNANFNSTVRLINSTLNVMPGDTSGEGPHDLELDESYLDLLHGSHIHLIDDADLEVEDNGGLWLSGGSSISATGSSNIQTQLSHILVEGGSSITLDKKAQWNNTQEFDMTPAQAAAVCDKPFQPDTAAEFCFNNKQQCKERFRELSGPERQALGMVQFPPALDKWGRQAFDYTDDITYDDYYDSDYTEPKLQAGECLSGPEVCGSSSSSSASKGGKRLRSLLAAAAPAVPEPAPVPADPAQAATDDDADVSTTEISPASNSTSATATTPGANDDSQDAASTDQDASTDDQNADGSDQDAGPSAVVQNAVAPNTDGDDPAADGDNPQGYLTATEINAPDTLDGKGYDPAWGEGPFGETLCDAPPGRSFNYYGLVVRDNSNIRISGGSSWVLYDTSRAFIVNSRITISSGSTLHLMNSTLVLINSVLDISGQSQIILERFSSLQLYGGSRVVGDGALYAVPAGSTWQGQQWMQRGDYRASPGGGLPVFMGARPGVQLGTYPMRVFGFDLDARLLPAAGCDCKKPHAAGTAPAARVVNVPSTGDNKGWAATLEGLI